MQVVQRRDAATLLPIIQTRTAPGSIVHSDAWAAYRRVQGLGNVAAHNVVNHSLNFVDPVTGVHTQHVESYWNRVKTKLKRMKGCHAGQLPSYLDEFLWRERYGKTGGEAWISIIRDIAGQYPV
jgi:transposase-like protein